VYRNHRYIANTLATIVRFVLDAKHSDAFVLPADFGRREFSLPVKNLGWLLRHHNDVLHPVVGVGFYVKGWRYAPNGTMPVPIEHFNPVLIAALDDGRFYATQWADVTLLHEWLNRPVFQHYIVNWDYSASYGFAGPQTCAIGGKDYADLPVRRDHPSRWNEPERITA
jgi:hypothetical protein